MPVLDNYTGESLEYCQILCHPKYKDMLNTFYPNELRRLCQGVGTGKSGPQNKRVKGTDTFRVIKFHDIPQGRRKEICHTSVLCEIRPNKENPKYTRITVAGTHICYIGDVATPTRSLELVNLIINSVLLRPGSRFPCFDIKNFYLDTPMDRS